MEMQQASVPASSSDRDPPVQAVLGSHVALGCSHADPTPVPSLAGAGVVICNYNHGFCFCKSVCK